MCNASIKDFPTAQAYRAFVCASADLADQVQDGLEANDRKFLDQIQSLDGRRFGGQNPDWGHREIAQSIRTYIFERGDEHALTLFVLACWYDIQENYRSVWTKRLPQLSKWVDTPPQRQDGLPRARHHKKQKAPHAWKTWQKCKPGGFGTWLTATVTRIKNENPDGVGNLRRFVAALVLELMEPGLETRRVAERDLGNGKYAFAQMKRAWMLTMCLRRDRGLIKCLIERALRPIEGGSNALELWYDGTSFPETESELPVDSRMQKLGSQLFIESSLKGIARAAHDWGYRHNLAPSTLDALFFSMD